jgi:PAS domain S-box-containing protein
MWHKKNNPDGFIDSNYPLKGEELPPAHTEESSSEFEIARDSSIQELKSHKAEIEAQNEKLKRLQLEFQESRDFYADLFEKAPMGYFLLDRRLLIIRSNLTGKQMLGVKHADLSGSRFSIFVAPEDWNRFYGCFDSSGKTAEPTKDLCKIEVKMLRLNNSYFDAELSIAEESNPELGWIYRMAVSDISTYKQTQEKLNRALAEAQASRSILEAMFQHIPMGIVVINASNMKFLYISRYASRVVDEIFRRSENGKFEPWKILYHPDGTPAKEEEMHLWRTIKNGETVEQEEWLVQIQQRMKQSILCSAAPIRDLKGSIIAGVVAWQDITQLKEVQAELNEITEKLATKVDQRTAELKERARQLQKLSMELSEAEECERKRLSEILHDDLQQLLVASKLQLSAMHNHYRSDASLYESIGQVESIVAEAIEKTRNLSHELSPGVLNQNDFCEAIRWLANQMEAAHCLKVRIFAGRPVAIRSGVLRILLYRTVQELLLNIVKHSGVNEANIRIRSRRECIAISVSDSGRGFDPQNIDKKAGFGLLSIKDRIEILGGRLKIRSVKGKGSRFSIAMMCDAKHMDPNPSEPVLRPDAGLRVLVADDHEVIREGLISLLNEEPEIKIVGEASNGREAIKLAHRLKPDVAMIDISMPEISGEEVARFIKANAPETRVIALSMGNESEMVENMLKAGADAHVIKTASRNEVMQVIRGVD